MSTTYTRAELERAARFYARGQTCEYCAQQRCSECSHRTTYKGWELRVGDHGASLIVKLECPISHLPSFSVAI